MPRYILGFLATTFFIIVAWHWSPLQKIDSEQLMRWSEPLAKHPAVPLIIIASYVAAAFILFPRPILTLASVGIFGPWPTAVYGMAGLLLAAAMAFWFGATYGAPRFQGWNRPGFDAIASKVRRGGIFSVVVIRTMPVAPFTVVNIFVGTLGIRFSNFIIGTVIGLMPGTLTTIVVGDRILAALQHTRWTDVGIAVGVSAAAIVMSILLRRAIR
jgi:phospholipase D1/2